MRLKIALLRSSEAGISSNWFGFMRTISAASIATSVPEAREMPMLAVARAGESLMPSPTIATIWPDACSFSMISCLPLGRIPEWTFAGGIPTRAATCWAAAAWSPVTREAVIFMRCRAAMAARAEGLRMSEREMWPV